MTQRAWLLLASILLAPPAWAQEFSVAALIGAWEFVAYAERSAPEQKTPVGIVFEFKEGGTMVTKTPNGDIESTYKVDGNTMTYAGDGGEQTWEVSSFEPDESLVMQNDSVLMYLERR